MSPLAGVRVLDCSLLAPGATAMHLADLGAEVIKIEPPGGDYVRELTWPIVEGSSLMHHHVSRGKRSLVLDLRKPEAVAVFLELVARSDVLIEAMRPGALARRGLDWPRLSAANPALVYCSVSGYGADGPYRDLPAHGIAFDAWAGVVAPARDAEGRCHIPEHASIGMHAGPLFACTAILAALLRARAEGTGACLEIGQADAAAYMDWLRSETWKAYERPATEVTGNATDGYARRAPGTAGMEGGVRYQFYESADGHVLFMASEQAFWRNFCAGIGRMDLYERWPGQRYGDHARGNEELRAILVPIFRARSTQEWVAFGLQHDTAIAPVNTPRSLLDDPHFRARFRWLPAAAHGADMLPFPVHFADGSLPEPARAPAAGEHSAAVLGEVLGYGPERIETLRAARVLG
jgi:crotonobetainyl-CoA:carnitine CoA-transferase CaiB-like acyl-CoA transferase